MRTLLALLFIIFIISTTSWGFEIEYLTSYQEDLYNMESEFNKDSTKVIKLIEASDDYIRTQLDTSYMLVLNALEISEEIKCDYCIGKSMCQMAKVLRFKGKYSKALEYANRSYRIFDDMGLDKEKAEALKITGIIYQRTGDYKESVSNLISSLEIYQNLEDSLQISNVFNNLGLLFLDMKEYDKSLEYLNRSLVIKERLGEKELLVTNLMNIGLVYDALNNKSKTLNYYQEAIKYTSEETSKFTQALLLHNMGLVYQASRLFDDAINYYAKAVEIEKEIGEKDLYISSTQGLGTLMLMKGKSDEGLKYIKEAYKLSKEQGDIYKTKSICNSLMWAYYRLEDYKTSLQYYDTLIIVNDSLLNIEKIRLVTQIEEKHQAEKRKQQIAFLEKEKEIQELEFIKQKNQAKQKAQQRNFLIVIVFLTSIILVLLARENKRRQKRNKLLIDQNKKIIDQRTEIVQRNQDLLDSNKTKDKLFQIIAHDLRSPLVSIDSLTQLIPYWVEEQDYESLKKLSTTMELSVTNVLSLIDNLLNWALSQQGKFPFNPEKFKIIETLQDALNLYLPIAELKHIDLVLLKSKEAFVFADKNMFLTIVRNLINNAIKFTPEEGSVRIGLNYSENYVDVWIEDTGVGIPEHKKEEIFELTNTNNKGTIGEVGKGLGLFFCKEFASINNGDIYIESTPNKGTKITFTVPIFNQ